MANFSLIRDEPDTPDAPSPGEKESLEILNHEQRQWSPVRTDETSLASTFYKDSLEDKQTENGTKEFKSKPKLKKFIPFYSSFAFSNRVLKSPEKKKKENKMMGTKQLDYEELEEEKNVIDESEQETYKDKEHSGPCLFAENQIYYSTGEKIIHDDEIPEELEIKKNIRSPRLGTKSGSDCKKQSLVKSRIAKYQKNSNRYHTLNCHSVKEISATAKSKSLDNRRRHSEEEHSDTYREESALPKFPIQVTNRSYGKMGFGNDFPSLLSDKPCNEKEIYDELKLIYDGEEIYAVREHPAPPRSHLSIDAITLFADSNVKASLNISVSGSEKPALSDLRWNEGHKFSRRSIRRSYKKKKNVPRLSGKAQELISKRSSNYPGLQGYCNKDELLQEYIGEDVSVKEERPLKHTVFPEYAKVNKKKQDSVELLSSDKKILQEVENCPSGSSSSSGSPSIDRPLKKIAKTKKDLLNSKSGGTTKRANSFKNGKVCRKGSFTHTSGRPKIVKRCGVGGGYHETRQDCETSEQQPVKLRRRGSRNGRNGEYRLSVTVEPSTVASLTSKFNSLINQNQARNENLNSGKSFNEISVGNRIIGRVYNSPRASFKRKYRARTHRNRKSARRKQHQKSDESLFPEPANNMCFSTSTQEDEFTDEKPEEERLGDNKTDEQKVCDKIETALSSGKFKGETDESDAEEWPTAVCAEETCSAEERKESIREEVDSNTITEGEGQENSPPVSEEQPQDSGSSVEKEEQNKSEEGLSSSHQKSESIDSGILTDDNNLSIAASSQQLPSNQGNSILEKLDDNEVENLIEPSNLEINREKDCIQKGEDDTSPEADSDLKSLNDCEVAEPESSNLLEEEDPESSRVDVIENLDGDLSPVGEEQPLNLGKEAETKTEEEETKESDSKIYSSILKSVVKSTVRKTKEKDSQKKTNDKEGKPKESWFRRGRSRDRADSQEVSNPVASGIQEPVSEEKKNDSQTTNLPIESEAKDSTTKVKSNKDSGKIYEKWIFKKLREKSQDRKKNKELTAVEVDLQEPKDQAPALVDANKKLDCTVSSQSNNPTNEKEETYGLWSRKSRGRNKDKKKTRTSIVKESLGTSQPLPEDSLSQDSSSVTEKSSSPSSSVRTLHSRKLSDTSTCTMDSETTHGKNRETKLKASHSQRSNSSIPPPPKTPIPSPPKSARIILNISGNEDEDKDDSKGSAENIYENLYSPNIDKLKKNRAKLEERGIMPNTSFLWTEGQTTYLAEHPKSPKIYEKCKQPFTKITGIKGFGRSDKLKRDSSLPAIVKATEENNYSQISSDDSHTTAAYDEIGRLSALSYDDIRSTAACSYDDVRAPSSVGYDSIKPPSSGGGYDPVNPPSAKSDSSQYDECDGIMTAHRAIVRDNLDSVSYLYDDITYNVSLSSHSYEPVNPPDSLTAVSPGIPPPLALGPTVHGISSIEEIPEQENSPGPKTPVVQGKTLKIVFLRK